MVKDEIEDEFVEVEGLDEVGEVDDVGIFDEDLAGVDDDLGLEEGDLVLGEDDSGVEDAFFIGDTILSSGNGEESWSKEDLEEVLRNERIERDWGDSDEFVEGGFYDAGSGNFYGASESRDGFYESGRGDDLYKKESGGDGVYATGKGGKDGVYNVGGKGMKSYEQVVDNRRRHGGRSMLEQAGFEDKEKQKDRDSHSLMEYSAGGAGDRK